MIIQEYWDEKYPDTPADVILSSAAEGLILKAHGKVNSDKPIAIVFFAEAMSANPTDDEVVAAMGRLHKAHQAQAASFK